MMKRAVVCGFSVIFLIMGYAGISLSTTDMGPADITMGSEEEGKKPPAVFPHEMHQEAYACGDCHHGMNDAGEKVAYTEGMEIKKCAECHNPDVLGGKKSGRYKLDELEGAGHGNCLECHRDVAKADDSKKKLRSCNTCHVK